MTIEKEEQQAKIFLCFVLLFFFAMISKLFFLQIIDGGKYKKISERNAARTSRILAPRGIIYDRYGKIIVSNKATFSAYLNVNQLELNEYSKQKLSKILNIPGPKINYHIAEGKKNPSEPILIKDGLNLHEVTQIEEKIFNFPNIMIRVRPVRNYFYKKTAAHMLGYIGEVTKEDVERLRDKGFKSGDFIGKMGIEKYYDSYLRGVDGAVGTEVDAFGRPGKKVDLLAPIPGNDLKLTIDIELAAAVETIIGNSRGAVVVINPNNGEVLAIESHPTFDPDMFTGPLDREKWKNIDKEGKPFLNRAISAFDAGSIFKVVSLSAALQEKLFESDETFHCPGFFQLGRRIARCWKTTGHGTVTLIEGLVQSCDVVFYQVGLKAGLDTLSSYSRKYGLGAKTGIDLPQESGGVVPSLEWLEKVYHMKWYPGDSLNLGIGQGYLQVTPIQMVNAYAEIANGKKRYAPFIVKEITSRQGDVLYSREPHTIGNIPISAENLELIRKALYDVVERATGRRAKIEGFHASGKTGTAENPHGGAHAWFLCYAPSEKPEIAIAVFVEHGLHGDQSAAGIARDILTWYRDNRYLKTQNPK